MNKNKFVIVLLLLICTVIGNASATMYEAKVDTYKAELDDGGNITRWQSFDNGLWIGQSEHKVIFDGIEVEFTQASEDLSYGMFKINKGSDTEWINPTVGNFEIIEDFELKIVLTQIKEQSGTIGIISDDDSVVSIWIEPNSADKLGLSTGDIPNVFNPVDYGKTAGWSSAGNTEEVKLLIEKLEDVSGILVVIDGGDWEEVPTSDNDKRIFELYDNVEYTITVSYTEVDVWDGESDEVDKYILSVSGLEASSSSTVSSTGLLGSFSNDAGNKIVVTTAYDGEFSESAGLNVKPSGQNADGNYVWDVTFSSPGTKRIDFVSTNGGEGYFDFKISAKQDTSESNPTSGENDTGKENDSKTGLILIGLGVIAAIVLLVFNKKGKNKKASNIATPDGAL